MKHSRLFQHCQIDLKVTKKILFCSESREVANALRAPPSCLLRFPSVTFYKTMRRHETRSSAFDAIRFPISRGLLCECERVCVSVRVCTHVHLVLCSFIMCADSCHHGRDRVASAQWPPLLVLWTRTHTQPSPPQTPVGRVARMEVSPRSLSRLAVFAQGSPWRVSAVVCVGVCPFLLLRDKLSVCAPRTRWGSGRLPVRVTLVSRKVLTSPG